MSTKQSYHDPVTGDTLTRGERVSWAIQSIIRNWLFLGVITFLTLAAWLTTNGTVLLWWNLCASYLALMIESIVGLGMFAQTRRDAVVMREIRTMSHHLEDVAEQQFHLVEQIEQQLVRLANLEEITGKLSPLVTQETAPGIFPPHIQHEESTQRSEPL